MRPRRHHPRRAHRDGRSRRRPARPRRPPGRVAFHGPRAGRRVRADRRREQRRRRGPRPADACDRADRTRWSRPRLASSWPTSSAASRASKRRSWRSTPAARGRPWRSPTMATEARSGATGGAVPHLAPEPLLRPRQHLRQDHARLAACVHRRRRADGRDHARRQRGDHEGLSHGGVSGRAVQPGHERQRRGVRDRRQGGQPRDHGRLRPVEVRPALPVGRGHLVDDGPLRHAGGEAQRRQPRVRRSVAVRQAPHRAGEGWRPTSRP